PRSRNECVNLCILRESLKNESGKDNENCVYYHNVISSYMLNYYDKQLQSNMARFCTSHT
ncbi:hypothetical protein BLA29_014890, partial [Euroglyphus maynei]